MKTKTKTKQLKQARQNKQAAKMSKPAIVAQYVATGVFFSAILTVLINMI